jgi:hypothetical protein
LVPMLPYQVDRLVPSVVAAAPRNDRRVILISDLLRAIVAVRRCRASLTQPPAGRYQGGGVRDVQTSKSHDSAVTLD